MSAAQLLLRRLLDQSVENDTATYLLVIDGEGLEDLPIEMATPNGTHAVHRVTTEIGLRHLLWRARGAPIIVVLPEVLALKIRKSPDLIRRARNQRVHALSVNDVLEVVLGVRVVGAESKYLQQLALEHIHKLGTALHHRTLPTVIDRRLLTELLVDASLGEHVRSRSPGHLLAAWLTAPLDWPKNVTQLVVDALPSLHGDEGKLLAWAISGEDSRIRLAELLTHGALLTVESPDLPEKIWGPFGVVGKEKSIEMDRTTLSRTLTRLAIQALHELGDAAGPYLDTADRLGRELLTPNQLQTSRVLPLAFSTRCASLARGAANGHAIQSKDIEWLKTHSAARLHRSDLVVLEAMARLSRFIDKPAVLDSDVGDQVKGYQFHGAFADLAMLQLRRALAASVHYHAEAGTLLAHCRERRGRENLHFAQSIAKGYEAALHREGLTPLHRIWKRTVAPVWQSDPAARLFLIVLDGCSYPIFLELLYALSQDSTFPIGISPGADGTVAGAPALSPLPTVTSHARGAIFLGELPNDPLVAETVFRDQDEAKTDKARFNQNLALGDRSRKLFLKGDLADGGQQLLVALSDPSLSVVATVFNAVDDQIGSSNTGALVRITPEDITAFKPALKVALQQGRRVLITADHGHSTYIDKGLRMGAGKAPRYLPLASNESPPEGFIEIDVGGLGGPPERRGFAWRSGAYLGGPQVGFHGGCSLEEMVVPLAWLKKDGLHADEPNWWYGNSEPMLTSNEPHRPADPAIIRDVVPVPLPPPPVVQPTLFAPKDPAIVLLLTPDLIASLHEDELSVLLLLRENGSARATELAAKLKKNIVRLNGLMRTLRRTLHKEGVVLFSDEVLPDGEVLYRYQAPEKR